MRIASGGYEHETNTFSTIPVTMEKVTRVKLSGQELIDRCTGVHCMMGGFIDECKVLNIELLPALRANIAPCGATEQAAFEEFRDEFVAQLWAMHCEEPLDAIALNIHGAAVAEGYPDLEAALLQALRERFGKEILIGMVLDLHGNITPDMVEMSDIIVGFKTYPHVDTYESARLLIRLLHEQITNKKHLSQAIVQLPWHIAPAFGVTLSGPAHDIMIYNQKLVENHSELRDITFFHGFPYADVPFAGASVTAVAETPEAARHFAKLAAEYAWGKRFEFKAPINSAQKAMELAEQAEWPVVINESSDNPGGGAPGDGTHLLKEMLRRNLPNTVFGYIHDPEVVKQAIETGIGNHMDCILGAKRDDRHGTPVELKGVYIKTISDGTFIRKNPMGAGGVTQLGPIVLLQSGNVNIIVSAARIQTLDDGPFRIVGIDWRDMRILALKSSQHFKGWWTGRAKTIIPCDSPGIQSADLNGFTYHYLNTNHFPFSEAEW